MKHKLEVVKSPLLEMIAKRTPIETRLRVLFSMEWLVMNIVPERQTTDEEDKKAHEWANKMVKWVMSDFEEWEKDGRPKENTPYEILERKINRSEFSSRTHNCLRCGGIETIGDIVKYSKNDLLRLRNCGKKSVDEIILVIESLGLTLADKK